MPNHVRTVPTSSTAITAQWLTNALQRVGSLGPASSVTAVQAEPLSAGVGFMGEVARLRVEYDGPVDLPPTMIAKIPTQNEQLRSMLAPAAVFEREARFYETVCPQIPEISGRCWSATIDLENDDFLLLLEDLSALRMGDQLAGCTVDDAARALEAAALLHAAFWHSPKLDMLTWMPEVNSAGMKIGEHVYAASLGGFQQLFGSALDPSLDRLVERFGPNAPQLLDRFAAMPTTVSHFDYRLDNLFFDDTPGANTVRMIDFQTSSKGGFIYDVGYLLSQSLSVADRRNNEDSLLRSYHDALVGAGVAGYSFDQLRADYRVGVLYGWIIPVFAVGSLDVSSERAMALWTDVIKRSQAAMSDHAVADLLTA